MTPFTRLLKGRSKIEIEQIQGAWGLCHTIQDTLLGERKSSDLFLGIKNDRPVFIDSPVNVFDFVDTAGKKRMFICPDKVIPLSLGSSIPVKNICFQIANMGNKDLPFPAANHLLFIARQSMKRRGGKYHVDDLLDMFFHALISRILIFDQDFPTPSSLARGSWISESDSPITITECKGRGGIPNNITPITERRLKVFESEINASPRDAEWRSIPGHMASVEMFLIEKRLHGLLGFIPPVVHVPTRETMTDTPVCDFMVFLDIVFGKPPFHPMIKNHGPVIMEGAPAKTWVRLAPPWDSEDEEAWLVMITGFVKQNPRSFYEDHRFVIRGEGENKGENNVSNH